MLSLVRFSCSRYARSRVDSYQLPPRQASGDSKIGYQSARPEIPLDCSVSYSDVVLVCVRPNPHTSTEYQMVSSTRYQRVYEGISIKSVSPPGDLSAGFSGARELPGILPRAIVSSSGGSPRVSGRGDTDLILMPSYMKLNQDHRGPTQGPSA